MFYNHVSSWIDSYYNADALDWLRRFVLGSQQPQEIKDSLLLLIEQKTAKIKEEPFFWKHDDMQLLMQGNGKNPHPQTFTTRYAAMSKVATLRLMGYDVRLVEGSAFFRIQLVQPEPINCVKPATTIVTLHDHQGDTPVTIIETI